MSTLQGACRALRIAFALSLVAAFAPVSGCASGSAPEPRSEAAAEFVAPGTYTCFITGTTIPASLVILPGPAGSTTCSLNSELPGSSRLYCTQGMFGALLCPGCDDLRASSGCAPD